MRLSEILLLLLANLALSLAVLLAAWAVARRREDLGFIDAVWPLAMLLMALGAFVQADGDPVRKGLLTWLCAVWAVQTAWPLWAKWRREGPRAGYASITDDWAGRGWSRARTWLLIFFLPQGLLAWLISLPVQLGQANPSPTIGALGWAGAVIAVGGVALGSVADSRPGVRRFRGLGDLAVWWGLYLIAAETGPGRWAILGPVLLTWMVLRDLRVRAAPEHPKP